MLLAINLTFYITFTFKLHQKLIRTKQFWIWYTHYIQNNHNYGIFHHFFFKNRKIFWKYFQCNLVIELHPRNFIQHTIICLCFRKTDKIFHNVVPAVNQFLPFFQLCISDGANCHKLWDECMSCNNCRLKMYYEIRHI